MNANHSRSIFVWFCAFLCGLVGLPCFTLAATRLVAVRNVTVIDVAGSRTLPERTLIIQGERIASIGPARSTPIPQNAQVVNGQGKYLIPGLWDMHVHLWHEENQLPVYVAFGVTGVRDMGSNFLKTQQWRAEIEKGKAIGPHIVTPGAALNGDDLHDEKLPILRVQTPADARRIFDYLYDQNVDFIRILPSLPRFAYFALTEQGRHWGVPIAGDLPFSVSVAEAITNRQSSIEHLSRMFLACSAEAEELEIEAERAALAGNAAALERIENRALDTFSETKAQELLQRCALFETRQVPELTRFERAASDSAEIECDPRVSFVPRSVRNQWKRVGRRLSSDDLAYRHKRYEKALEMVRVMERYHVGIMAGTDTGNPDTIPGATLHDELRLLVQAGLTPMEALRSATVVPAKYLGWDDALGTVEKGKVADLVLLNADPLADIANTQKIAGVFLRGRYLSKTELIHILSSVK
ncbi:MAG TPA: amidohydrolase family protein [Bryobacteraceae bacterium]|nr:amidohydrolase family protein [Bryobacteraceae bacterium]